MSDPYIHNITQKYRLAVAIAVLKSKPEDVSIETYIEDLKSKINNDNTDDIDLTFCSDDFEMQDDIINNNNDKTLINDVNNKEREDLDDILVKNSDTGHNKRDNCKEINIDDTQTNKVSNDNCITILENYNVLRCNNQLVIENKRMDTGLKQDIFGEKRKTNDIHVESQAQEHVSQNELPIDSQSTFCESQQVQNTISQTNANQICDFDTIFKLNELTQTNEIDLKEANEVQMNVDANKEHLIVSDETYYDSQATELYNWNINTQNYTHISQSQNYEPIVINDKFLKVKYNIETPDMAHYKTIKETANCNDQSNLNVNQNSVTVINIAQKHITNNPSTEINKLTNKYNNNTNETEKKSTENQLSMLINESFPQYAQDINEIHISENITIENDKTNECNSKINEEISDNNTNETQIVPFKVIEELNKIKNYITKKAERRISNDGSIDSGYRSDSQSKYSVRSSLQLTGNWLNQSAYSLFEYITQCPLLATTHEIIGEIAQVLGQLIDRLHEEEKYPSFLDELLDIVNTLLQELFQETCGDDLLLQKDENIQRILLLNKSVHIQKYTIEKITSLLENLLPHLTNTENTYEITNISEMENISYIFHILEVILQRYIKVKDMLSQESNSQIELKKSYLTEMWRKRWNTDYKEENIPEFTPKRCVLVKCNEILNKIIVNCMDGYSLVAFSALNCFNMLQN